MYTYIYIYIHMYIALQVHGPALEVGVADGVEEEHGRVLFFENLLLLSLFAVGSFCLFRCGVLLNKYMYGFSL